MIHIIFTIDYEIFGNGEGSLRELVYDPAEKLMALFRKWDARFVVFVEAAELEVLESAGTDPAIGVVKQQIKDFFSDGFEIGLHLHPQWYDARYESGKWLLDYSEYNLCTLPQNRIVQIVDRSIAYLRRVLGVPDFLPFSFRAGNWLFQPTQPAAKVLAERGIKVDSSVFKGGLRHEHGLDYRQALRNGYFWKFNGDVGTPDPNGALIELPIYTQMAPIRKMLSSKRIDMERKGSTGQSIRQRINRLLDLLRFRHPLKLDYCRMTIDELIGMMDKIIMEDRLDSTSFRPVVAIGHTKELVDFETIASFLSILKQKEIAISTFEEIYHRCNPGCESGKKLQA